MKGVTLAEAGKIAKSFPNVTEGARYGNRTWLAANGKAFAWERPFSKADLKRFGDVAPPAGPIVAVAVADLMEKDAALDANKKAFFDIPHFKGYPAFLVQLSKVSKTDFTRAIEQAYRSVAPIDATVVEQKDLRAATKLSSSQQRQLGIAGTLYFGKGPPVRIGEDDGGDPMKRRTLLFTKFCRVAVEGKVTYDAWLYMSDSGTIFQTNTTTPVAQVIQGSLQCNDPQIAAALTTALGDARLISVSRRKERS